MTHIQLYKACSENVAIKTLVLQKVGSTPPTPHLAPWVVRQLLSRDQRMTNHLSVWFQEMSCKQVKLQFPSRLPSGLWGIDGRSMENSVNLFRLLRGRFSEFKTAPCFYFGPRNIAMIPELTEVRYLTVKIDAFMEVTEIHGRMKRYSEMFKILIKLLETDWNIVLKAWSLCNLYIHLFQKFLKA